eukprot:7589185-Prorocentrum_lima.AAC.1
MAAGVDDSLQPGHKQSGISDSFGAALEDVDPRTCRPRDPDAQVEVRWCHDYQGQGERSRVTR